MPVVGFADDDEFDRAADAVRQVETWLGSDDPARPARRGPRPEPLFVKVTGAAVSGLYPAVFTLWDSDALDWADTDGECKAKAVDGSALAVNKRYAGRIAGVSDGKPVVIVTAAAAGGESEGCTARNIARFWGLRRECLRATVAATPSGRCASIDGAQVVTLLPDGAGDPADTWTGGTLITDALTGDLQFTRPVGTAPPMLTLSDDDTSYTFGYIGCVNGVLAFAGGQAPVCTGDDGEDCANQVVILIDCVPCVCTGSLQIADHGGNADEYDLFGAAALGFAMAAPESFLCDAGSDRTRGFVFRDAGVWYLRLVDARTGGLFDVTVAAVTVTRVDADHIEIDFGTVPLGTTGCNDTESTTAFVALACPGIGDLDA